MYFGHLEVVAPEVIGASRNLEVQICMPVCILEFGKEEDKEPAKAVSAHLKPLPSSALAPNIIC